MLGKWLKVTTQLKNYRNQILTWVLLTWVTRDFPKA